jgi:hypothetical protein
MQLLAGQNTGRAAKKTKFPVNFPVSTEFTPETGSTMTASSANKINHLPVLRRSENRLGKQRVSRLQNVMQIAFHPASH